MDEDQVLYPCHGHDHPLGENIVFLGIYALDPLNSKSRDVFHSLSYAVLNTGPFHQTRSVNNAIQ